MAYLRLFRRIRIAPGLALNVTKAGPSLSLGVHGAHVTIGRSGVRRTASLPGTGLFYTSTDGRHSGAHTSRAFHEAAPALTGWRRVARALAETVLLFFLAMLAVGVIGLIVFR